MQAKSDGEIESEAQRVARGSAAGYSWWMDQDTTIDKILAEAKTIAVVGFSSDPHKAGYYVPAYLQQHGYRIIPVNPNLSQGLGEPAYATLADVPEPIDLVLLFQRSENVPPFVDQAITCGARAVWMLSLIHI